MEELRLSQSCQFGPFGDQSEAQQQDQSSGLPPQEAPVDYYFLFFSAESKTGPKQQEKRVHKGKEAGQV